MPTLKERLIRIGFCETDVARAIDALGPDAPIDEAGHWIALAQINRIFSAAGMREHVRMEDDDGR